MDEVWAALRQGSLVNRSLEFCCLGLGAVAVGAFVDKGGYLSHGQVQTPRARLYLKQQVQKRSLPPTDVKSLNRPLLTALDGPRAVEPHLLGEVEDWLRDTAPSSSDGV